MDILFSSFFLFLRGVVYGRGQGRGRIERGYREELSVKEGIWVEVGSSD